MRTAGIREVRQNLSALLREVRRGREILITDRGEPVARLLPTLEGSGRAFPDLATFRRAQPKLDPPLSSTLAEDRVDRL